MNAHGDITDHAIGWHLRLVEASEADWTDFVAWLGADPAHAAAYDAVAVQDRLMIESHFPELMPEQIAANDNGKALWAWLGGGTVAGAVVAALVAPSLFAPQPSSYQVATRAGERRIVALADGTSVEMSGGTALTFDRANPRVASLDRGEAVFHVRHNDRQPFVMTAGAVTVRDVGTVFNVARDGERLSVAVAEGSVLFQPTRDALTLKAGDVVAARSDGSNVVLTKTDPVSVGGWRVGMLGFQGQRLGDVVAKVERLYAVHVTLDGNLSDQPFTGMVRFTGAADRDVPHLAALIGVSWRRDGERWIFSGRNGPSR